MEIFGEAKIRGSESKRETKQSIFYKGTLVLLVIQNAGHALLFDYDNIVLPCVCGKISFF